MHTMMWSETLVLLQDRSETNKIWFWSGLTNLVLFTLLEHYDRNIALTSSIIMRLQCNMVYVQQLNFL